MGEKLSLEFTADGNINDHTINVKIDTELFILKSGIKSTTPNPIGFTKANILIDHEGSWKNFVNKVEASIDDKKLSQTSSLKNTDKKTVGQFAYGGALGKGSFEFTHNGDYKEFTEQYTVNLFGKEKTLDF